MFHLILTIMTAVGAPMALEISATKAVNTHRPENVMVKFDAQAPTVDGPLLTLITGVGHAPYKLEMATFRVVQGKVHVFVSEYHGMGLAKDMRASTDLDRNYPEADFYYDIKAGEISLATFKALTQELSQIHSMKTYKEYKIYASKPIGFESKEPDRTGTGVGGSMMTSSNFASIVNLWSDKNNGFIYGSAGYASTEMAEAALKVNAMEMIISKVLEKTKLSQVPVIFPAHREYFNHQFEVVQQYYDAEYWWWVKERTLSLAGILGSEKTVKSLVGEFQNFHAQASSVFKDEKNPQKKALERVRYLAASALARITKKDFRFDEKGKPLPIEATAKKYTQEFPPNQL